MWDLLLRWNEIATFVHLLLYNDLFQWKGMGFPWIIERCLPRPQVHNKGFHACMLCCIMPLFSIMSLAELSALLDSSWPGWELIESHQNQWSIDFPSLLGGTSQGFTPCHIQLASHNIYFASCDTSSSIKWASGNLNTNPLFDVGKIRGMLYKER